MKTLRIAAIVIGLIAMSSCPNPLTPTMTLHVKDTIDPLIEIYSPDEGSFCANIVEVVGRVTDAATSGGNDGQVRSLSFGIPGSALSEQVAFTADGSFRFQFATVTLADNFTLLVTATDWNGNSVETSRSFQKQAGNGIPSFLASPDNGEVTLSWDAIPHTTSYTLCYTTNGLLPSENTGQKRENATSPCVLSGLRNGNLHVFQLKAIAESGWPDSVSDFIMTIPLGKQTLAPRVTGEFGQIRIEWPSIPATQEFEVWRSIEQTGTYFPLAGLVEGNSFIDIDVHTGDWYWYKVKPTMTGTSLSHPNGAQAAPFPEYPTVTGIAEYEDTGSEGVAVYGSFVYVADGSRGLRVIDISILTSPSVTRTCSAITGGGICVAGARAYVADGISGMRIVDLADPAAPVEVGRCPTTEAFGVASNYPYAYVADGTSGLRVVNVTNPASPTVVGTCPTTWAVNVAVSGSYAYVADGEDGLRIINVSIPSSPSLVGTYPGDNACAVAVSGHYAYVVNGWLEGKGSHLQIINVQNPSAPTIVGSCTITDGRGVAVSGSFAYVTDGISGLRVINISNPASPSTVSTYQSRASGGIVVSGSHAFFNSAIRGLIVVDLINPTGMQLAGTCDIDYSLDVAISGSFAYVAADVSGLHIIDISDPQTPSLTGTCPSIRGVAVAVSGPYAYVIDDPEGLRIVDISDPSHPKLVSTCPDYWAMGIAVSGQYAYLADIIAGLLVIDISNPAEPVRVGMLATSGGRSVAIQGLTLYMGSSTNLLVIDISNPLSPALLGTRELGGGCFDIAVSGSHAFVAAGDAGVQVVDVSDPRHPGVPTTCLDSGSAYAIDVSGPYAYAPGNQGFKLISIADPSSPSLLAELPFTWGSTAVSGSRAYVVDWSDGLLRVVDLLP